MPVITIFSASYCRGDEVAGRVAEELGIKLIDREVIDWASAEFGVSGEKLIKVVQGSTSILDRLVHDRERYVAYLKAAIAEQAKANNIVYYGFLGHLLPRDVTHILKVCLVASRDYRAALAVEKDGMSKKNAQKLVKKDDEEHKKWTEHLFNLGPWDKSLYDIKIPMHSTSVEDAVKTICENALKQPLATTAESQKALEDFAFAARVNVALVEQGHNVDVLSDDGNVTILINEYVLRVEHLKEELKKIADAVPGVKATDVRLGPKFTRPNVFEFEMPSKVLLVDDEKEFVETLSERLQMRSLDTAIVYNGEEALSYLKDQEPEVMILDLRMPGIDGVEVLRRVKKNHPNVEVIILTGHGTERDAALTRELGAFAYLEKPVGIDELAKTVQAAYEKLRKKKAGDSGASE